MVSGAHLEDDSQESEPMSDSAGSESDIEGSENSMDDVDRLEKSFAVADDEDSFPPRHMRLQQNQANYLTGWGMRFVEQINKVSKGFKDWLASLGTMTVWEDCSGAHAPHYALAELGIRSKTMVACDYATGPQKFSRINVQVAEFQPNLMLRTPTPPKSILLYTAGFPCKPFSSLRNSTKLLQDKEARQFWKVTATIREQRPRMVVLENVQGLRKVIDDVMEELNSIPGYFIAHFDIDPFKLGCPTSRPRIYILMLVRDLLIEGTNEELKRKAERVLEVGLKLSSPMRNVTLVCASGYTILQTQGPTHTTHAQAQAQADPHAHAQAHNTPHTRPRPRARAHTHRQHAHSARIHAESIEQILVVPVSSRCVPEALHGDDRPQSETLLFRDKDDVKRWHEECHCNGCKGLPDQGATWNLEKKPTSQVKCRWRHAHWHFMADHAISPSDVVKEFRSIPKNTGLSAPRARHIFACHRVINKVRKTKGMPCYKIPNASQSIHRCSARVDGVPTLTPGGVYVTLDNCRILTPEDRLLLMGFPLATIDLGANTQCEIQQLAGNAMHVRSVAAAILMGLFLMKRIDFKDEVKKGQPSKLK